MQVYKTYMRLIKKNLVSVLIYAAIFLALLGMYSTYGEENVTGNFESAQMNIVIKDEDNSEASRALSDYLKGIHNVLEGDWSKDQIKDKLYYREMDYVLTIPAGFSEKLTDGEREELLECINLPGSARGIFADNQVNAYLSNVQTYLAGGFEMSEAVEMTNQTIAEMEEVEVFSFEGENTAVGQIYFFYQYLPYILIGLLLTSVVTILIKMNKDDLKDRINCSALSSISRSIQTTLGSVTYSLGLFVACMLVGILFYGSDMFTEKSLLCILNAFVFLLVSVTLALLLGAFAPSLNAINMISNVFSVGMSFLCGVFVPQSMLGEQVLGIAKFLPAYWYIKNNNMIYGMENEVFELGAYRNGLLIQLLFAFGIFTAYLVVTKLKRRKA